MQTLPSGEQIGEIKKRKEEKMDGHNQIVQAARNDSKRGNEKATII